MSRILLINPNTSRGVTERMQRLLLPLLPPGHTLTARTARAGARYISCEASYAVASFATLDTWARDRARQPTPLEGVLIGCFGDPGLFALRESAACRVTGLAEASFLRAARHGPFGIVTGGERWGPMLRRLAQGLGCAGDLVAIETIALTGAQAAAEPARALALLDQACRSVAAAGAKAIIVGGAGLAGMAARLQEGQAVPLIDSVLAGLDVLLTGDCPAPARARDGFVAEWAHMPKAFAAVEAGPDDGAAPRPALMHAYGTDRSRPMPQRSASTDSTRTRKP